VSCFMACWPRRRASFTNTTTGRSRIVMIATLSSRWHCRRC